MPIRPEERIRYPKDWPDISRGLKANRAKGRCECTGQCRRNECGPDRCPARHGYPAPVSGRIVVLTTAHLNHTPEDCRPANLLVMCQACHLAYDAEHHARVRKARAIAAESAAYDGDLFGPG